MGMAEDNSPGYSDAEKPKNLCHPGTLEGPKYEVEWKASLGCLGRPALTREKRAVEGGGWGGRGGDGSGNVLRSAADTPPWLGRARAGQEGSPGLERSSGDEGFGWG